MKILSIILLNLFYSMINSIQFYVQKSTQRCYYLEMELQKIMQIQFKIQGKYKTKCHIRLSVEHQVEETQQQQVYQQNVAKGFQCDQNNPNYYLQKFTAIPNVPPTQYRICVKSVIIYQPILVQLIINDIINPLMNYDKSEQNMSLVTSTQLRSLHNNVHTVLHQLNSLQYLQKQFFGTEEQLTQHNIKLREEIKLITFIQTMIIIVISICWVWILKKAKV